MKNTDEEKIYKEIETYMSKANLYLGYVTITAAYSLVCLLANKNEDFFPPLRIVMVGLSIIFSLAMAREVVRLKKQLTGKVNEQERG